MNRAGPFWRRALWTFVCFSVSLALHIAPVWFILFGPVYDAPKSIEIDLQALQLYRERIFRELTRQNQDLPLQPPPPPIQISMVSRAVPAEKLRLSSDLGEEDLKRARIVQTAMNTLWSQMYCTKSGRAVVRIDILQDGHIGTCAVISLQGNTEFQAFLATFLSVFQASYAGQAGPGQVLRLECEFVVKPSKHFTQRNS